MPKRQDRDSFFSCGYYADQLGYDKAFSFSYLGDLLVQSAYPMIILVCMILKIKMQFFPLPFPIMGITSCSIHTRIG